MKEAISEKRVEQAAEEECGCLCGRGLFGAALDHVFAAVDLSEWYRGVEQTYVRVY